MIRSPPELEMVEPKLGILLHEELGRGHSFFPHNVCKPVDNFNCIVKNICASICVSTVAGSLKIRSTCHH